VRAGPLIPKLRDPEGGLKENSIRLKMYLYKEELE